MVRAKSIEDSLSNGRKIFRFLLFLNEYGEINEILKNTKRPIGLKILKLLSAVCSHNYYFFDNIVWFTQIGILNKQFHSKYKWKKLKDTFSLWKTIFEVIISVYVVIIKTAKEQAIYRDLTREEGKKIRQNTRQYVLMRNLILIRRKIKFHQMEVFIYLMRMIMLIFSLKLVGHNQLHPIFVSICGLFQAIAVVYKSMKGKKKFYKLTTADVTVDAAGGGGLGGSANEAMPLDNRTTMILSQAEFNKQKQVSGSSLHQHLTIGHHHGVVSNASSPQLPDTTGGMAGLDYDTTPPTFVEAVGTGAESGSEAEPSDLQRRHSENLDEVKVEHIDDVYDVDSVKPTHVL